MNYTDPFMLVGEHPTGEGQVYLYSDSINLGGCGPVAGRVYERRTGSSSSPCDPSSTPSPRCAALTASTAVCRRAPLAMSCAVRGASSAPHGPYFTPSPKGHR